MILPAPVLSSLGVSGAKVFNKCFFKLFRRNRKQIRREIDAHDLGFLVHDVINETSLTACASRPRLPGVSSEADCRRDKSAPPKDSWRPANRHRFCLVSLLPNEHGLQFVASFAFIEILARSSLETRQPVFARRVASMNLLCVILGSLATTWRLIFVTVAPALEYSTVTVAVVDISRCPEPLSPILSLRPLKNSRHELPQLTPWGRQLIRHHLAEYHDLPAAYYARFPVTLHDGHHGRWN
jgi:hypothetical protein